MSFGGVFFFLTWPGKHSLRCSFFALKMQHLLTLIIIDVHFLAVTSPTPTKETEKDEDEQLELGSCQVNKPVLQVK